MEITNYLEFIKEQFKDIITENNFQLKNHNQFTVFLEKNNIRIELSTIYREDGVILLIGNLNKFYSLNDIFEKKIGGNDYLTEEDKQKCKSFNDKIKVGIYVFHLILKNHCQDLLNGDFSSLE